MSDTNHLIMFYATDCSHCEAMLPKINALLEQTGIEIDLREVDPKNAASVELFDSYADGHCEGVPLFINTKTEARLCGEVSLEELTMWATA